MAAQPDNSARKRPAQQWQSGEVLRDQYQSAVRRALAEDPRSCESLPQVLMQVCAAVLPGAGAGLSLTSELRIPLSASSAHVTEAERLQTSLGEGPCLSATAGSQALTANADEMTQQWPVFAHELRRRTPFRSVAALPLDPGDGSWRGAVDLYSTDPGAPFGSPDELHAALAAPIVAFMRGADGWSTDLLKMGVRPTSAYRRRMAVWTAVGMVMATAEIEHGDALALLRAFTFRHELDLDTAAELLVRHTLPPEAVLDVD